MSPGGLGWKFSGWMVEIAQRMACSTYYTAGGDAHAPRENLRRLGLVTAEAAAGLVEEVAERGADDRAAEVVQ